MVKVVTDSVADMPSQVVEELGITVVPLVVRFGTEAYHDGLDLTADQFYEKLKRWNVKYVVQHRNLYDEGPIPWEHKKYVHSVVAREKYNNGIPEKLPEWYKVETEIGDSVVYAIR